MAQDGEILGAVVEAGGRVGEFVGAVGAGIAVGEEGDEALSARGSATGSG